MSANSAIIPLAIWVTRGIGAGLVIGDFPRRHEDFSLYEWTCHVSRRNFHGVLIKTFIWQDNVDGFEHISANLIK